MRVKYLIEQLKEYDPDDEIIVAYWDKDHIEFNLNGKLTDDQWIDLVGVGDNVIENLYIGEYIRAAAYEILDKAADDE